MKKKISKDDRRAAADAARLKADEAREAADAKPDDADLGKTATDLETAAAELETAAEEPSHDQGQERDVSKRDKRKKRMQILLDEENSDREAEGLAPLSLEEFKDQDDEDEEDDDEAPDEDKPLTTRDLKKLGVIKSVESMVAAIKDTELRNAVASELKNVSKTLSPEIRYQKALALASAGKNERVAQEAQRMAGRRVQQFGSGSNGSRRGADDDDEDEDFVPTAIEKRYMERGFSKAEILQSRKDARTGNFGGKIQKNPRNKK